MKIKFDGISAGTLCYYNISSLTWENAGYKQKRGYKFTYDNLNRMTNAAYGERDNLSDKAGHYNETLEYDIKRQHHAAAAQRAETRRAIRQNRQSAPFTQWQPTGGDQRGCRADIKQRGVQPERKRGTSARLQWLWSPAIGRNARHRHD